MKLKLANNYNVSFIDYPNLTEWCVSLYTIGCPHGCVGCHNQSLQLVSYDNCEEYNFSEFSELLARLSISNRTTNFCILGGEPLAPWNRDFIIYSLPRLGQYNFCIYTGYNIDEVKQMNLSGFKYLKTGRYIEGLETVATGEEVFRLATTNQELYNGRFELLSNNGVFNYKDKR